MGRKYRQKKLARATAAKAVGSSGFRAPTSGLEDAVFTVGKTRDAAVFGETKSALAKHVGVQSWRGAAVPVKLKNPVG